MHSFFWLVGTTFGSVNNLTLDNVASVDLRSCVCPTSRQEDAELCLVEYCCVDWLSRVGVVSSDSDRGQPR